MKLNIQIEIKMDMENNFIKMVKKKFESEYLNGKEWNGIRYDNNGIIDDEVIYGKKKIKE